MVSAFVLAALSVGTVLTTSEVCLDVVEVVALVDA